MISIPAYYLVLCKNVEAFMSFNFIKYMALLKMSMTKPVHLAMFEMVELKRSARTPGSFW